MSQYKYPVRHFSGAGVRIVPPVVFKYQGELLDQRTNMRAPILGETGLDGVLIDFNYGLRLQIPRGNWHVRIADADSDYVFVDDDFSAVTLISWEKFWINWEVTLWRDGDPVFYHQFDPTGQKVHFQFMHSTLGDNIALLLYVEAFRKKFDCEVSCSIPAVFVDIMKNYYPKVRLTEELPEETYACFYMRTPFNMPLTATEDAARIPLLRVGHSILRSIELPSKVLFTPTEPREILEPYVCIGVQASSTTKCWLNPNGWEQVVEYLKSLDYRVLCIDRDRLCSNHGLTVEMPRGAEDFSGKYTLLDRINQLAYADFFIGVSSGLSWLAWSADIPVIMISGITEPWYEFDTPYRINNPLVCHGCFNEIRERSRLESCPIFKDTNRAYECSKKISARQVIKMIDRLISDLKLGGAR